MSADVTASTARAVTVTAAGVQVLSDDRTRQEHAMTVPDPTGQPDIERPIDLTDTPQHDKPGPAPTPEHHTDRVDRAGDDGGAPEPDVTPVD
jgi:hypothetical protein